MNENEKTTDIVNTTDCLEAASAFKAMKNFLFIIAVTCLLLLQGVFWLERAGLIDKTDCPQIFGPGAETAPGLFMKYFVFDANRIPAGVAKDTIAEQAEHVTKEMADQPGQSSDAPAADDDAEKKTSVFQIHRPSCRLVAYLVKCCNFVLIPVVMLYCIILFMSIKISLTGRLGGINHISRAFFQSLFALAFLLPWQTCFRFPNVIHGAVYTPEELLCPARLQVSLGVIFEIFRYLRFTGLWIIVILLLICAQLRSRRWTKATLRRLGILH